MFKFLKLKIIFVNCFTILFGVSLVLLPQVVNASEFYFGTEVQEQVVGSTFAVGLFINSEEELINAVEGKVRYPTDILELKEIRDGDSAVNFWVEKPEGKCEQNCFVQFAGVTPGGFVSDRGHLFSMIFSAKKLGEAEVSVSDGKVLRHDGTGSQTSLKNSPIKLQILKEGEVREFSLPFDQEPPESFVPFVGQDAEIFDNKFFLVFATQDKLSGVDHYEIQENAKQKIEDKKWKVAVSPYLLEDQNLSSFIYVKAVDKSGNERIQIILPQKPINLLQKYAIYGIMVLVLLLLYLLGRKIWRKKQLQN